MLRKKREPQACSCTCTIGHHWGDQGLLNSNLESFHEISDLNTEGSQTKLSEEARQITRPHEGDW